MANITTTEAKQILNRWVIVCDPQSARNAQRIAALIERLQCCGNCRYSAMNFLGGAKMLCQKTISGAMDNYAKDKCEHWEATV